MAFQGHRDPYGFAQRIGPRLRDPRRDAGRSFVAESGGMPTAGAHMLPPDPEAHDQSLHLMQLWYEDDPADLTRLLEELLAKQPHEAVYVPLHGLLPRTVGKLAAALEPLGFGKDRYHRLRFDLVDVPPLGSPLVLEAWNPGADRAFRDLFERSEGEVSERTWSWMKRKHGPFFPDLWFLARETLDQEPSGYAFCGALQQGIDASYYLTAVGVLPEHRDTSEMLRRVVVTTLEQLSVRSPLGRIETTLSGADPKLVSILHSLGFRTVDAYDLYVKIPR